MYLKRDGDFLSLCERRRKVSVAMITPTSDEHPRTFLGLRLVV
jgi:hypothetical protein